MFKVLRKTHKKIFDKKSYTSTHASHRRVGYNAQVMIEFTFCMIVLFIMFYGIIMILRWTGIDLAQRRISHEAVLFKAVVEDYGLCLGNVTPWGCLGGYDPASYYRGPLGQIDPSFYIPMRMNAVWSGETHY